MIDLPKDVPSSPRVPSMFTDDEPPEPTPITNLQELFSKMADTASIIKRQQPLIAKIPEIEKTAEESRRATVELQEQVIIVRTRQEDTFTRLDRIEKNGHPCVLRPEIEPKISAIERFVDHQVERQEKDAEAIARLTKATETYDNSEKERKALSRTVLALLVTIVLSAAGSAGIVVTQVHELRSDQRVDRQASEHRDELLSQRLKTLPTSEHIEESSESVRELAKAVKEGSDDLELQLLRATLKGMTAHQRTKWCQINNDQLPPGLHKVCSTR